MAVAEGTRRRVRAARPRRRAPFRPGQALLALPPVAYLLALLVFPIVLIGLYSVNLLTNLVVPTEFSLTDWEDFLPPGESVFWDRFESSMVVTLVVSVVAVLAAYPVAFYLAFVAHKRRYTLLLLLLAPFFTSYLLRILAWDVMLRGQGVINSALWELGLRADGDPVPWLINSKFAIGLVLFYSWVPFVALPIYVVLENLDRRLLEAAQDLGASRFGAFLRVTLPLSLPGVVAAFVFVLIPTTGEFVAPLFVGGPDDYLFGNFIQSFFLGTPDWNYGAVMAMWLMFVVIVLVAISARFLTLDMRAGRG
jgi:spermidine/putrescine transport system permease protein